MDNRPIGVFDSGIGGLTVVSAMAKIFPSEVFLYVGDNARVPYGNSQENSTIPMKQCYCKKRVS